MQSGPMTLRCSLFATLFPLVFGHVVENEWLWDENDQVILQGSSHEDKSSPCFSVKSAMPVTTIRVKKSLCMHDVQNSESEAHEN